MASIVIHVTGLGAIQGSPDLHIGGECRTSGMTTSDQSIEWRIQVAHNTTAAVTNDLIKAAAIAAAVGAGFGPIDQPVKKIIILGGAVA